LHVISARLSGETSMTSGLKLANFNLAYEH